jgi:hypothetical protein
MWGSNSTVVTCRLAMFDGIKDYLWVHPWLHATLVVLPPLVVAIIALWRENHHSHMSNQLRVEANRLETEANRFRTEANDLRDQLNKAVSRIAHNTAKVPTESEKNAEKLRKHLGEHAQITEGTGGWASSAQIVEVGDDIITLFVPAGFSSSSAYAQMVRCDKLHLVEPPSGLVQIKIVERYGGVIQLGDIRNWEDRGKPGQGQRPRGHNVFYVNYRLQGSSAMRGAYIYSPTDGNAEFTLVKFADGKETGALYGNGPEISKRFALTQIEWMNEGFITDGKGGGAKPSEGLFLFTM